ncbi:MAG: FtsX-like permease family protein [archaeon]|nr:FtsX-like permease family protein [archaeon]
MNVFKYAIKDLRSQKLRSIFGVLGIAISIFLLSTIFFLTDTISGSYAEFLTIDSGGIDFQITRRWQSEQPNEEYWMNYTDMELKIESATNEIDNYIPRAIQWYDTNYSGNEVRGLNFIGLNITHEKNIGFGGIAETDYDFETYGIPRGNCAISLFFSDLTGIKTGDLLNICRSRDENGYENKSMYMNLTVCSVFEPTLKFPSWQKDLVLVDIKDFGYCLNLSEGNTKSLSNFNGTCNYLYMTVKNSGQMYDVRNIEGSEKTMEAIAADIQDEIGYGYWVYMPKLQSLGFSQMISMISSIIFILIGLISMLIAGILISGILSTSVEERIREFGIFRCLGAHKVFNLKLVLIQGSFLCLGGTALGMLMAWGAVSQFLIPGLMTSELASGGIISGATTFVVQPSSIAIIALIGISVSLIVSIFPAFKVAKLEIVNAINPYRHDETLYKLERSQTVNYKLITVGVLLAVNGGFVFFFIPRLITTLDLTLIMSTLILLLVIFLIGLTMAGIAIMPILLRFWIYIFTPFTRKIMNIIKVTIFRHQRRNNSTILMFCLSFSFVMFVTSMIGIIMGQVTTLIEFQQGSPLVLYQTGTSLNAPTVEIQENLMQIEGIEITSVVVLNPSQLTDMYAEEGKEFGAGISDLIGYQSSDVFLYSCDSNYLDSTYTIYNDFSQGEEIDAFEKLLNGSNTCIISTAISESLAINLNDKVRLSFQRGDEQSIEEFVIVGVASKLSGFTRFKEGGFGGGTNGVLISQNNYINYMEIPNPVWVSKVFINIREDYSGDIDKINTVSEDIIESLGDDWSISVYNVASSTIIMKQDFAMIEILLSAVLSITIIICMFGLFSSSYSSIMERKREIGILRSLGLKKDGLGKLFTVESLIIMLSSGTTGAIVGYITAYLLANNMALFTDTPSILPFPLNTVIILFSISLITLLIGMRFLLRKLKSQNLIEIFRESV